MKTWDECAKLFKDSSTAVDDRRHGEVTHLIRAISVRDLRDQVKARLPPELPFPPSNGFVYSFG